MARVLTTGFETSTLSADEPCYVGGDGASGAIQTTNVRTGSKSFKVDPVNFLGTLGLETNAGNVTTYFRGYVKFTTFPVADQDGASSVNPFIAFGSSTGVVAFSINSGGTGIQTWGAGTSLGTTAISLSLNQWYRFEFEVDLSPASGSRIAGVRIDGVEIVRRTNLTVTYVDSSWNFGRSNTNSSNGVWYWDDVAINDNTGAAPHNTFPGDGYVVSLLPDGDGDADTGTPTRGGTDTGTIWGQVADDTDASYAIIPANPSDICVAMASLPSYVGPYDTVRFVEVHARISGATNSAANWFPGIISQSAGTRLYASAVALASSSVNVNDDTSTTKQAKLRALTDPQAGDAWTQALVNAMQCIARTTDGNPDTYIYRLWATIELVQVQYPRPLRTIPPQAVQRAATF